MAKNEEKTKIFLFFFFLLDELSKFIILNGFFWKKIINAFSYKRNFANIFHPKNKNFSKLSVNVILLFLFLKKKKKIK